MIAGARIELVRLARNCRSSIGDQRSPPVQVVLTPAIELLTRRAAPSSWNECTRGIFSAGEITGTSSSVNTSLVW